MTTTRTPYVGWGIGLTVVGLILAFAVADRLDGVDLTMIGYIGIGAGILLVILGLVMGRPRSVATTETTTAAPDGSAVTHERVTDGL